MIFKQLLMTRLAAAILLTFCLPGLARAMTYYVDPAAGSNANNGTSAATPWLNPPGTRLANDSGFWSNNWGAITASNKIGCGDLILLKGGSTQHAAQGGGWRIDPNFYTSGCATGSRLTLRVATSGEWSGSSGPFTIDGTGVTPTADAYLGYSDHTALIAVEGNVDYVELKGASTTQRLVVTNSAAWLLVVACHLGSSCSGPRSGFRGDWLDLHGGSDGFNIGGWNFWQISNSVAYNVVHGPWQTGMNNDIMVDKGGFVNVTAHDSGCGSVAAPTCTNTGWRDDLFFLVGGRSIWCQNCTAYNGGERGVNTGVIQNSNMGGDYVYHFRNLVSHDNGATCNLTSAGGAHWCAGAGIGTSGNDFASADTSRTYVVGAQLFHNGMQGGWSYGGGYLELWNATSYNTAYNFPYGSSVQFDTTAKNMIVANSIDTLQNTTIDQTFGWNNANSAEPQRQYTPTVVHSCFRPRAADTEPLGTNDGTGWPGVGTYAAPPAWIGSTNKVGLTKCDPKFVKLDPTTFANNDFHLQAGSSAIDAGRFFLLANGAGSNATTITVRANGGSSDPRSYFIAPDSFLDATADSVQIQGCAPAKITALTATTISFTPACSWSDWYGVHLPWAGSAPDMGAYESTAPPPAPVLMSVQAIPPTPAP